MEEKNFENNEQFLENSETIEETAEPAEATQAPVEAPAEEVPVEEEPAEEPVEEEPAEEPVEEAPAEEAPADLMEKAEEYAKENKKKQKASRVYDLVIYLCIGVFCVSAFFLGRWLWQNYMTKRVTDEALNAAELEQDKIKTDGGNVIAGMEGDDGSDKFSFLDLNMKELYAMNSDTVGWIRVNGTLVDYPVVQAGNNEYYLYRDFNENVTDAGCPFLDFRNNPTDITANRNFIIYGHARKDRSIFGSLDFCRQSWWQNNEEFHLIRYTSLNQKTVWKVFSVYTIDVDGFYYIQTDFGSDYEFENFANTLENLSIYDFGVDVGAGDTILTLSTCAYNGDDRLVVHAKLVQAENYDGNEDIEDTVSQQ